MDFVKNAMGGSGDNNKTEGGNQQGGGGGFMGGIGNKLNEAGGGGKEGEKNEDYLDKGQPFAAPFTYHNRFLPNIFWFDCD